MKKQIIDIYKIATILFLLVVFSTNSFALCNGGWTKSQSVTGGKHGKYRTTFEIKLTQQDDGYTVTSVLGLTLKVQKRVLGIWTKGKPDSVSVSGAFGGTRTPLKKDGTIGYFNSNPFLLDNNISETFKHFEDVAPSSAPCYSMYSATYVFTTVIDGVTLTNHIWW